MFSYEPGAEIEVGKQFFFSSSFRPKACQHYPVIQVGHLHRLHKQSLGQLYVTSIVLRTCNTSD